MLHFPRFMSAHHDRRVENEKEKELSMKGWDDTELAESKQGFANQHHLSRGIGYHFARNSITRGRGQARFTGK